MSSNALTPLTDRPDSFSGGASRIDFTGRCDLVRFRWPHIDDDPDAKSYWFRFPLAHQPDCFSAFLDLYIHEPPEGVTLSETDADRLLCHLLLQRMPDEGLKEAIESLSGMCEFYRLPAGSPKPLPAPKSVRARITGSYVAPVFPATEE